MVIIPAIDILNKKCVRLTNGRPDFQTIYSSDPIKIAQEFCKNGAYFIHIVDLSKAIYKDSCNIEIIENIVKSVNANFQVGGGIDSLDRIDKLIKIGVKRVIIGSSAVKNPLFIKDAVKIFSSDKICIGIDVKNGNIAVDGWKNRSEWDAVGFGMLMRDYGADRFIITDISKDGTLKGPSINMIKNFAKTVGGKITASGGVSSITDIEKIAALTPYGIDSLIIGKALYENRFKYEEAVKFLKNRRKYAD